MKSKIFPVLITLVVVFATKQASAYYSPSTGRWLSRDPNGEPGFELLRSAGAVPRVGQVANAASLPPGRLFVRDTVATQKEPNRYVFVSNGSLDRIDRLGLDTSAMPGIPHVSPDRHNNYLIFYIGCPSGFKVSHVKVDYNDANMYAEMYQWDLASGAQSFDPNPPPESWYAEMVGNALSSSDGLWSGTGSFGGLQGLPDYQPNINCLGQPVEEHAYMRTRLVASTWYFELWRGLFGTPDPATMIGIYQENTQIHYLCDQCCKK